MVKVLHRLHLQVEEFFLFVVVLCELDDVLVGLNFFECVSYLEGVVAEYFPSVSCRHSLLEVELNDFQVVLRHSRAPSRFLRGLLLRAGIVSVWFECSGVL